MKSFILASLLALALTTSITPVPNFNLAQLAQGSGGMYFGWYISSVYDTVHNWDQDACATSSFAFGSDWGLMTNATQYLDSEKSWVQGETPLYWDVNNEAVLYSDESKTKVAFIVANWSLSFVDGYEINRAILAQNNSQGGVTIYGLSTVGMLGDYFDISDWLNAHGLTPNKDQNYFFLDNWCSVTAPSLVWDVYKNSSNILGSWNVLAVYDTNEIVSWNSTNCTHFTFTQEDDNLIGFALNYVNSNGNQSEGTWSLIPDTSNATVYVGYYFGDQSSTHTIFEVFYTDIAGNIGIIDNQACFAAFMSQKTTNIDQSMVKLFKDFVNAWSPYGCQNHDSTAFYFPNEGSCGSTVQKSRFGIPSLLRHEINS